MNTILFSNPPWWLANDEIMGVRAGSRWPHTFSSCGNRPDKFQFGSYAPVPFFLCYAASYARLHTGMEVILRDSIALRESYQTYFNYVERLKPEFIIIETATPSWEHDSGVIRKLKELTPDSKIVLTGTISEADPERLIEEFGLTAIIKGEYEKGVVEVVGGRVGVVPHMLLTVEEMNAAPFPEYPADCWDHFCDHQPRGMEFPHAQVWASRGCKWRCVWCSWPATMTGNDPNGDQPRNFRFYTKDYMLAYLTELLAKHPFRSVYFDDDTFNGSQKHTSEMCEVMRKIGLKWGAMCRADTLKPEGWREMREAGCFGVKLGFETGSQRVIDEVIGKKLDLARAADTAKFLRSIGMTVHATFTLGSPGERPEERKMTHDFIAKLYRDGAIDTHQLSGTEEIAGTPMANLKKEGHLKSYPGAVVDENYISSSDSREKLNLIGAE